MCMSQVILEKNHLLTGSCEGSIQNQVLFLTFAVAGTTTDLNNQR